MKCSFKRFCIPAMKINKEADFIYFYLIFSLTLTFFKAE